jgi:hypothetical protein
MAEFLSKRVRKKDPLQLNEIRYEFLSLEEAEPDLGNPLVGPSSIGAKPFPDGSAFILASFASSIRADRYWVPPSSLTGLGLGVIPGAFTIRSNNSIVGLANSFTTLNFVGSGISVDQVGINAEDQTGIATVRVVYPGFGDVRSFQYHGDSGFLAGATQFVFNPNGNNVGIGSTLPTSKLDIIGNVKISGISTLNILNVNNILSTSVVNSGVTTTNSLSIGSTQVISSDRQLQNITSLDSITTETIETAIANAPNTFTDLNVLGVGTFGGILYANSGINALGISSIVNLVSDSANIQSTITENLVVSGISTIGFLTANNSFVSGISTVGFISATNGRVTNTLTVGFVTSNTLNVSSSATITSLNTTNLVSTNLSSNNLNVSVAGTITTLNSNNIISNTIQNSSDLISGRIGIGTTPAYELDVDGDIKTNGLIYVSNGNGITGQVLLSRGIDPPVWGAPDNITVGAAQSIFITDQINDSDLYYLTLTKEVNNVGFINVDTDGLIYNPSTNSLGIGTTLPGFNLDVSGNINFSGLLYKEGQVYIASRWGADETETTLYKLGNVGIGTTVVPSTLTVKGDSLFDGPVNFIDEVDLNSTTNIKASVSERVVSNFNNNYNVNSGKLTLNISQSTVVVGVLTQAITTWEFVGVDTSSAKATTLTLIIDSDSLLSYGDLYSVVGLGTVGIVTTGNVRWSGGIAPQPTNNDDILSFTVISDQSGKIRVYGTSSLNFS